MPNLQNSAQTLAVFGDVTRVYDCGHFQGLNLSQPLGLLHLALALRRTESTLQRLGWAWLSSQESVG